MPDSPTRTRDETAIAAIIYRLIQEITEAALYRLEATPNSNRVPKDFWTAARKRIEAELEPAISVVYWDAAARAYAQLGWPEDSPSTIRNVERMVKRHLEVLAQSVTATIRRDVQEQIKKLRAEDIALGVYLAMLWADGPWAEYSETVGITETTRSITRGESAAVEAIDREITDATPQTPPAARTPARTQPEHPYSDITGLTREEIEQARRESIRESGKLDPLVYLEKLFSPHTIDMIWHTEQDDKVCPICRPAHDQPMDFWIGIAPEGPPAHIRCRCWLTYRFKRGTHGPPP